MRHSFAHKKRWFTRSGVAVLRVFPAGKEKCNGAVALDAAAWKERSGAVHQPGLLIGTI